MRILLSKLFIVFLSISFISTPSVSNAQNAWKEGIRTGIELERFASKRKAFFRKKKTTINRSSNDVTAALQQLAKQCISGIQSRTNVQSGVGIGATNRNYSRAYDAKISNEDGTKRFLVLMADTGGIKLSKGSKGFNVVVATQIKPTGNGKTQLLTTHGVTFDLFHKAAVAWASGKQTGCPKFR